MSFGLEGGWSITIPLVWLLPMLRVSSVRWVESGVMVCNLSDLLLLISPSWHSMNLACPSSSLTVLIPGGDVVPMVCELPRSQCLTLADCWSLRLSMSVGEEGSGGAVEEGWWATVDGKWASCLGKMNRDHIWYTITIMTCVPPTPDTIPPPAFSCRRFTSKFTESVHRTQAVVLPQVRKSYLSCGQYTNTCTTIELLHAC